jgi:hypothetical protein
MKIEAILDFVRKKVILSISSVVFLVCTLVFLFHLDKKANLDAEIEQLDIRMSTILKNIKNSLRLEEDLAVVEDSIEQLDARLFDSQELATNYNYFFNIEADTGVKISGLKQFDVSEDEVRSNKKKRMPKPTKDAYQKIRYHMMAIGEYMQLVDLMRKLEGGPSFYRLEKFRVSKGTGTDSSKLSMDMSLLILGRNASS